MMIRNNMDEVIYGSDDETDRADDTFRDKFSDEVQSAPLTFKTASSPIIKKKKPATKPKQKSILDLLRLNEQDEDFEIDDLNLIGIKSPQSKARKKTRKTAEKFRFTDIVTQAKGRNSILSKCHATS